MGGRFRTTRPPPPGGNRRYGKADEPCPIPGLASWSKAVRGSFFRTVLARGIWWPDGLALLDGCTRLQQSSAPVVLVPRRLPAFEALANKPWTIRVLSEIAHLSGGSFEVADDG